MSSGYSAEYTERERRVMYRRLRRIYRESQRDIEKKLNDFLAGSARREAMYKKRVESGAMSQAFFDNWKRGQVFIGDRWRAKLDQITGSINEANLKALTMIHKEQCKVFAENSNYCAYEIERDTSGGKVKGKAAVSFDIYDEATVEKLIQEKPELMPRSTWNDRKDKAWNRGIISNSITQGIIQGESIPQIAERISRDTENRNENAMIRYARTAMTCAQNAGRIETMHRAEGMGIKIQKQWLATLDGRTRDSHQHLDGQIQDVDKPFDSQLGKIMYPGDPTANQANVWNCRCTLVNVYPDYDSGDKGKRRDQETGEEIEYMTYDEWKAWKEENRPEFQIVPKPPKEDGRKPEKENEYIPDKYDLALESIDARYEKAQQDEKERRKKIEQEMQKASNEAAEYRNLKHYVSQDVSKYDSLKTQEEYENKREELEEQIEKLHNEYDKLRANRVRSENFDSEAEYDRAFEQYLNRKHALQDRINEVEQEFYQMRDWGFIENARAANALGEEEIERRITEAREKYDRLNIEYSKTSDELRKINQEIKTFGIEKTAAEAKSKGIEWLTPAKRETPFDMQQVIDKISGPDKTEGCCASLAFAYIGQKGGYDVIDYRGGESRELFSKRCVAMLESMREYGTSSAVGEAKSYTTAGKRALSQVKEGKEYYFECGRHAAMVRMVHGDLQYLELQSGYRPNKWYSFSQYGIDKTLKWRFGSGVKTFGWNVNSYLVDADEMAKDERFLKILGYINTEPSKQMKGSGGGEK